MASQTTTVTLSAFGAITLLSFAGQAATIDAASCEQSAVQAAVDAAADGDTVAVPAGSCTWAAPVFTSGKAVTIQGAGIDRTTITDATTSDWQQSPFWIEGEEGRPFRITGFTLTGQNDYYGVIHIRGDGKGWRIDNIKFVGLPDRCINIGGYSYGLIDHCEFEDTGQPLAANGDADAAWMRPLSLGTENAVYVEDCIVRRTDGGAAIDAHDGGRYVYRHNTLYNAHVHAHGCCNTSRGVFSYEIYENDIIVDDTMVGDPTMWTAVGMRGGTGVIFDNRITGPVYHPILVVNYRSCHTDTHNACQAEFDRCDGDSPYDGNEDATGYPCRDQIGRSTDSGQFTAQTLEPLYQWGNTVDGASTVVVDVNDITDYFTCTNPSMTDHIQAGRDYFDETERPGYTPYVYPHPLNDGSAGGGAAGGAGGSSGGGADAAPGDATDGGCGCRAAGREGGKSGGGLGLLVLLMGRRRARRSPDASDSPR